MRRRTLILAVASLTLTFGTITGCGDETSDAGPFTIELSPEFVQGVIPGAATGVLATIHNQVATDEPVQLTASAAGAVVTVSPSAIAEGDVAEVTVVADPATEERPIDIVVTGRRGAVEATATASTTLFAWNDDRGEYAHELLDVFTAWLADNRPELGISPDTEFTGSFVAPGLLVVSHYCYMSSEWELGLSWHVMIAPDDWADLYLRPRAELQPTLAFRMSSQSAALQDGEVEIVPVEPPFEVVR